MEQKVNMIIYQAKNGAIMLRKDAKKETLWANQKEIAQIFSVSPQNITIHLKRIFNERELSKNSTCKESLQVQMEGKRKVKRKILEYNLDVIIAVGYRINSIIGTKFRQWATKTLRSHIVQGYTLNATRIKKNYDDFLRAVEDVKKLIPAQGTLGTDETLELVKTFANTWFSLDAYDKSSFPIKGATKKRVDITADELKKDVSEFKNE